MDTLKKWSSSWAAIVIAFIIFWPIGCVLLYFRFFVNDGKLKANSNLFWGLAIGCYFIILGGLMNAVEETGSDLQSTLVMLIAFIIAAAIFTILAIKKGKQHKYYKKYADYILARRNMTIEELAEKTGDSIEDVIRNVTKVIDNKMIEGYINSENQIILTNNDNTYNNTVMQEKVQIFTVKCKNCGATNKFVSGKANRCEYCDSLLSNE